MQYLGEGTPPLRLLTIPPPIDKNACKLRRKSAFMHNGVIARALVLDKLVSTYLAQHPAQWSTLPAEHLLASYIFFIMQQTQYFLSDTPHHGPPTLFFIFYIIHSKSRARCHFRTGPCSISNS